MLWIKKRQEREWKREGILGNDIVEEHMVGNDGHRYPAVGINRINIQNIHMLVNNKLIRMKFNEKSIDKTWAIMYTINNKRNEIKTRRYGPPERDFSFSI
ncbi:hypothetical protein AAAU98_10455 [Enterocloster citroniae]